MTKNDFFNLALIEAMGQAMMGGLNANEAAESAKRYAANLDRFYETDTDPYQPELERRIIEVVVNHGRILCELTDRIEQLETQAANLQRIIEQNCPEWINKPALYGDEHK